MIGVKHYDAPTVDTEPTIDMFVGDEVIIQTLSKIAYVARNGVVEPLNIDTFTVLTDATYQIGTGGDFNTINDALIFLSDRIAASHNVTVTLNLMAGYTMTEQVLVSGQNYGLIQITSTDPVVTIDAAALTTEFSLDDYGLEAYPAFGVKRGGKLPTIAANFSFNSTGLELMKHGILSIGGGSTADILDNRQMLNAPEFGLYASDGGAIHATSIDVSGAYGYGLNVKRGSLISANFYTGTGNQQSKKITKDGIIF